MKYLIQLGGVFRGPRPTAEGEAVLRSWTFELDEAYRYSSVREAEEAWSDIPQSSRTWNGFSASKIVTEDEAQVWWIMNR